MSKVKLSYFDIDGSRGEECRLALYAAGVDFEDHRVGRKEWASIKPTTPFGAMPVLEIEGVGVLSQSNAILGLIGAKHGLLPENDFEAAQHIAILNACEDLRVRIARTLYMENDEEKKKAREEIVSGYMQDWSANMEKQIKGPFVAGDTLSVADIKIYVVMNWVKRGIIDHMPADSFDAYKTLSALFDAVVNHPKVVEWYSRKAA